MPKQIYRYRFKPTLSINEIKSTFFLALFAVECLHGVPRVQLDATYGMDANHRTLGIGTEGQVNQDLNCLFVGFLSHLFGENIFSVRLVNCVPSHSESEDARR